MPGNTWASIFFAYSSLAQDDAAARAAQGLVGGGGDKIRVRHRIGMHAGGHQAGDVGHVDKQIGADRGRFPPMRAKSMIRG